MDRRDFIKLSALASLMTKLGSASADDHGHEAADLSPEQHHEQIMQRYADLMGGPKLTIGMLVYPGMFPLDMVGPLAVFESLMNRDIHLLWKNLEPVGSQKPEHKSLIPVTSTTTFKDCPEPLDVLFVPGGVPGTLTMMEDPEVIGFLKQKGKTARFITSVCTGSLILGAAGLLDGYKATSHWVTLDVLKELGAIPTRDRVVVDRNRITGGGVTAGIDFGLQVTALLRNENYAKAVQLYLEYDPAPPFDSGSPEKAPAEVKRFLDEMFTGLREQASQTAIRSRKRAG